MGSITFIRKFSDEDKEFYRDVELTFEMPDDAGAAELHYTMKKFALALGYADSTVDSIFGEDLDWD